MSPLTTHFCVLFFYRSNFFLLLVCASFFYFFYSGFHYWEYQIKATEWGNLGWEEISYFPYKHIFRHHLIAVKQLAASYSEWDIIENFQIQFVLTQFFLSISFSLNNLLWGCLSPILMIVGDNLLLIKEQRHDWRQIWDIIIAELGLIPSGS